MTRDPAGQAAEFGIHSKLLRIDFGARAKQSPTAASSLFVEVQADFPSTPFRRRFVCLALKNCCANRQASFHRRILTAFRCASKPSASAIDSAASARYTKPLREIVCTLTHFTKSAADRPPWRRAHPAVGKT